ncbi:protein containing RNA polymerase sigma factor 70, region 4 type 2 domain protein, partial [gut metagenome]
GFKYREIAEKLDLPLGTVKSRIFLRARSCDMNFEISFDIAKFIQIV